MWYVTAVCLCGRLVVRGYVVWYGGTYGMVLVPVPGVYHQPTIPPIALLVVVAVRQQLRR